MYMLCYAFIDNSSNHSALHGKTPGSYIKIGFRQKCSLSVTLIGKVSNKILAIIENDFSLRLVHSDLSAELVNLTGQGE